MSRGDECTSCKYAAMDMDMMIYCCHPDVLKSNSYGSNIDVVRGAAFIRNDPKDDRNTKPHFDICGQEGKLFELRAQSGQ